MERVHLRITGLVQGVCFRANAMRAANRIGVKGWVRNLPDGSVEAECEGAPEAIQQMREWLAVGPAGARVDGVQELSPSGEAPYTSFQIRV